MCSLMKSFSLMSSWDKLLKDESYVTITPNKAEEQKKMTYYLAGFEFHNCKFYGTVFIDRINLRKDVQ